MKAVAITRTTEPRDVRGAVNTLALALREDADYRLGWEANIAMAFVDAMGRLKAELGKKSSLNKSEIHQAANEAAAQFLAELQRGATEIEPQCGLCGGEEFEPSEARSARWRITCTSCTLSRLIVKAQASAEALDEPNFSDAIDRYCSHTANVRKAFLSGEKK